MWIVFHFLSCLFCIAHCLVWKHIIVIYYLVEFVQLISAHLVFKERNKFLYITIFVSCVFFTSICMLIAKFVRNFLETINENKKLVQTIKNILQCLPEGVIIETKKNTKEYTIKFANLNAKRILFIEDPEEINISEINTKISIVQSSIKELKGINKEENKFQLDECKIYLNDIFTYHRNQIKNNHEEFLSSIESKSNNDIDNCSSHFIIKTIKVKWNSNNDAFMHVLTDVSSVKKYEKEKAINECLYILFSSLSHEFRTPLNTFCNAITVFDVV